MGQLPPIALLLIVNYLQDMILDWS